MAPERKEICDCRVLQHASREPGHPIRWDEKLQEYYIAYGKSGRMMIYYCPFCGGSTPKSRRSLLFHTLTDGERQRLSNLIKGLKTVDDVKAAFGEPDIYQPQGESRTVPERDGKPETTTVYSVMIYTKLSEVANIHVTIYPMDRVGFGFHGKPVKKDTNKE
jgi:hypothetical protein